MSDEKEKKKQTKDRSVAYPGVPLSEAIGFTSKLRDSLGKGPYSRDEAAKALGHSKLTGPAARKVAALVHYGLLERSGNTYSQSQLSQDILKPVSDELKNAAIKKAAIRPRLFQKLCQKFGGQALPSMLQNILIREGISEGAADEVVRIFTETMKFAELLVNGVLTKPVIEDENEDCVAEIQMPSSASKIPVQTSKQPSLVNRPAGNDDDFIFEFTGGVRLLIPRTKKTSEAIADGELKETRTALSVFASKHMQEEETKNEVTNLEDENA